MKHHRGYALYVALVLVGLAGLLIAATMSLLKTDVSRTHAELTQAQLRQLLLAGQASAAAELQRTGGLKSGAVPLPAELVDASLAIQVDRAAADRIEARVQARLQDTPAEQSLTYTRDNGRWVLTSAAVP